MYSMYSIGLLNSRCDRTKLLCKTMKLSRVKYKKPSCC